MGLLQQQPQQWWACCQACGRCCHARQWQQQGKHARKLTCLTQPSSGGNVACLHALPAHPHSRVVVVVLLQQ